MKLARPLLAFALAFTSASVLAPRLASAQAPTRPAAEETHHTEYRFLDDALLGGALDGSSPVIRVNPRASRSLLIRPRTSFVPELLTSADAI
jgi:hypothetical protein